MISDEVIRKSRKSIITQLTYICKCKETAEDAFQEACLKCYSSNSEYTKNGLYFAAKNCLTDILRYEHRRAKIRVNESLSGLIFVPYEELTPEQRDDLEVFEKRLDLVYRKMKRLAKTQVMVVQERIKRKSFKTIAKEQNKKLNTCLCAYHYAVKNLKTMIGK